LREERESATGGFLFTASSFFILLREGGPTCADMGDGLADDDCGDAGADGGCVDVGADPGLANGDGAYADAGPAEGDGVDAGAGGGLAAGCTAGNRRRALVCEAGRS
jgi:hypothetical protein